MSYIGNAPSLGNYTKLDDISSQFNGVKVSFNLTSGGLQVFLRSANAALLSVNGVLQEPGIAYTIGASANQITFSEAPATGSAFFGTVLGDAVNIGVPSDGTVTSAKIANGAVGSNQIADYSINGFKLQDGTINSFKLADSSVTNSKIVDNAITLQKIQDNAVVESKIASNAVTNSKVADFALGYYKMENNAWASALNMITGTVAKILSAEAFRSWLTTYTQLGARAAVPTAVDMTVTGLSTSMKRLVLKLDRISHTQADNTYNTAWMLQIGTASGIVTSGYESSSHLPGIAGESAGDCFSLKPAFGVGDDANRNYNYSINIYLTNVSGGNYTYMYEAIFGRVSGGAPGTDAANGNCMGTITLNGPMTQFRIRNRQAGGNWDNGFYSYYQEI